MARTYRITVNGAEHSATLLHRTGDSVTFELEGATHTVSLAPQNTFAVSHGEPSSGSTPPEPRDHPELLEVQNRESCALRCRDSLLPSKLRLATPSNVATRLL